MSVTPDDFIDAAETLILNNTEMDFRNAASRAYYGAYHRSFIYAHHHLGIPADVDGGSHYAVSESYLSKSDLSYRKVSILLRQAKAIRVTADYHLSVNFDENLAATALEQAKRIIESVDSLPT